MKTTLFILAALMVSGLNAGSSSSRGAPGGDCDGDGCRAGHGGSGGVAIGKLRIENFNRDSGPCRTIAQGQKGQNLDRSSLDRFP